ncbi:MAG: hypothetical protein AAF367_11800 [Pseudomonadota bacterium]
MRAYPLVDAGDSAALTTMAQQIADAPQAFPGLSTTDLDPSIRVPGSLALVIIATMDICLMGQTVIKRPCRSLDARPRDNKQESTLPLPAVIIGGFAVLRPWRAGCVVVWAATGERPASGTLPQRAQVLGMANAAARSQLAQTSSELQLIDFPDAGFPLCRCCWRPPHDGRLDLMRSSCRRARGSDPKSHSGIVQRTDICQLICLVGPVLIVAAGPEGLIWPVMRISAEVLAVVPGGIVLSAGVSGTVQRRISLPGQIMTCPRLIERHLNIFVPRVPSLVLPLILITVAPLARTL